MTAPDRVRGWCPSLFHPMESGDGWLARVRPQDGIIEAALALSIADAAARFGNGVIEVTNRANIQIRGLRPETIAPFTRMVEAAGGAEGEGSRLLVSPLLGADPSLAAETQAVGRAVSAALHRVGPRNKSADDDVEGPTVSQLSPAGSDPRVYPPGRPDSGSLPAKFGVVIDGGGALPLTGISLDITIRFIGGYWQVNGEVCAVADIPARVQALAGERKPRVTARIGAAPKPGFHALAQGGFVLLAPAFGQMTADSFAGLARLAQRHGDGKLRPTPWKSLCIAGVAAADATDLLRLAESLGFIADPDDGRLSVVTCAGAPSCARGEVETHRLAAILAQSRGAGDSRLHLSGCAKGCAHPGAAPVTLVGRAGQFDLVRDGRASDMPAIRDQTLAQIVAVMHSLRS